MHAFYSHQNVKNNFAILLIYDGLVFRSGGVRDFILQKAEKIAGALWVTTCMLVGELSLDLQLIFS